MAKYFFDYVSGEKTYEDQIGQELANEISAHIEGVRILAELAMDDVDHLGLPLSVTVKVRGDDGHLVRVALTIDRHH